MTLFPEILILWVWYGTQHKLFFKKTTIFPGLLLYKDGLLGLMRWALGSDELLSSPNSVTLGKLTLS